MARTYRKSNAVNRRKAFDDDAVYKRDGSWNGRYSREMEERENRSRRLKKFDKRSVQLDSLED
jgi:hypothetical protein